jgi:alkaline phosphatase D
MQRWIFLGILFTQWSYAAISNIQKLGQIDSLHTFAFGSCNSQHRSQPLWPSILKTAPQLWIWGGDNIYADTSNPNDIHHLYHVQNQVAGYQELKRSTPIIGIWDDHDFGYDNATASNPMKYISQELFLDFIDEPSKSKRRNIDGIYTSYEFGSVAQKVKFLLLDNRFFHSAPEENTDLLGQAQWQWLENELMTSKAQMHFIVAGLSILSPRIPKTEEWADHPRALNRLLALIDKHNPKGLVFLSGDKHFASVFNNYGHLEFMSSGMTHTVPKALRSYVARFYPNSFFGLNYGVVKIDWDKSPLEINLQVKTIRDEPVFNFKYYLDSDNRWKKR